MQVDKKGPLGKVLAKALRNSNESSQKKSRLPRAQLGSATQRAYGPAKGSSNGNNGSGKVKVGAGAKRDAAHGAKGAEEASPAPSRGLLGNLFGKR